MKTVEEIRKFVFRFCEWGTDKGYCFKPFSHPPALNDRWNQFLEETNALEAYKNQSQPIEKPFEEFLIERIRDTHNSIENGGQEAYPWDGFDTHQMEGMKRAYQDVLQTLRESQPIEKEQEVKHLNVIISTLKERFSEMENYNGMIVSRNKEQEQEIESLKDLVDTMKQGILKGDHLYGNLIFDEETKSQLMKQSDRIKELEAQLTKIHEATDQHINGDNWGDVLQTIQKALESFPTEQPEAQKEKDWTCYEIWRPNIPDDGCKEQCKECKQKQQNQPQPEKAQSPNCSESVEAVKGTAFLKLEKAQEEQSELEQFIEWCAKEKKAGELTDIYNQFKTRKHHD